MKIYKVTHITVGSEHNGYTYHTSKKAAEKEKRDDFSEWVENSGHADTIIETFDVSINKKSILEFLNLNCSHPDNG